MSKGKQSTPKAENIRLDPEQRLCPKFDFASIATFPVAPEGAMGVRWWTTAQKSTRCEPEPPFSRGIDVQLRRAQLSFPDFGYAQCM